MFLPHLIHNSRYACKGCGRYGTLHGQTGYSETVQQQVKRGVLERLSLRGLERLLAISRRTVQRWLAGWVQAVPALETTLTPAEPADVLELDELPDAGACAACAGAGALGATTSPLSI